MANIAGCFSGTVSRAINNHPGIHAETRKHILQMIDEAGYRPNVIAQSLASQQTHTIAQVTEQGLGFPEPYIWYGGLHDPQWVSGNGVFIPAGARD
ncbi:LacI family DNA-binding transcriptional regulator [Intestinibacillus massiliensis]